MAARNRYIESLHIRRSPTEAQQRNVAEMLKASFDSSGHMLGAVRKYAGAWQGKGGSLVVPWLNVPKSSINTRVDGARRFVAQSWSFDRVRAVGKAMDGTFNDAVLAMCSGALRTFLLNHGELPTQSLKSMVPVSLRREGDVDSSNAVGAISADLATNIKDPLQRFRAIKASMEAGKAMFQDMSPEEASLFLQLIQLPGLLLIPMGLGSRFPPYSTVISNVPGPRQPMYWNGARLEGIYPASIVTEGIALNITLVTYDKQVDFGIMACRRSLPQVQRFIDYLEDSLVELEEAAGIRRAETAKPAKAGTGGAKAGARPTAKAKAKASVKAKTRRPAPVQPRAKAAPAARAKSKARAKAGAQKPKLNAIPRLKPKAGAKVVPKSRARP